MKKFFYFLLFLILISLALFLYWFFSQKGYVPKIPNFPDNPFGIFNSHVNTPTNNGGNTNRGGQNNSTSTNGGATIIIPKEEVLFEKVWADPVAGYSFLDYITYENTSTVSTTTKNKKVEQVTAKSISSSTALLFVDRSTGHIYKKMIFSGKPPTKVTNTTIPGVYDAYFFKNNTEVLLRYLRTEDNTVMTLFAKLPPLSASVVLPLKEIKAFPENIVSIAVSPDQSEVSYLVKTITGSTLYTYKDDNETKVHDYDLSELTLLYKGKDIYVAQKPSAFEKGYFFTEDESLIYGGRTGQKILFSRTDPSIFLTSYWSEQGLKMYVDSLYSSSPHVYNTDTVVDKCVSSGLGNYFFCAVPRVIPLIPFGLPDDWYRGLVTFNDTLYVLDTVYHKENVLSYLEGDTGEEMDMIKMGVSTRDTYLAFLNKKNSALWVAKLGKLLTR